jgi:hypothetical protein
VHGGDDLGFAQPRLHQVERSLQTQPHVGGRSKDLLEPDGHIGRDAAALVDDLVEGLATDAERLRCFAHGHIEFRQAVVTDDAVGPGGSAKPCSFLLVIVQMAHVVGVAIDEAENDPPVAGHQMA